MIELRNILKNVDALLPINVYEKLFEIVASKRPSTIVEVGTAHGGATIAMALGAKSVDLKCKIFTIDTLESLPDIPSSRTKFGDRDTNIEIVRNNFKRCGVSDLIELFVGRSEEFPKKEMLKKIDLLFLDADGRIDRDLIFFREYLSKDTIIIIDDIDGGPKLSPSAGKKSIDLKHVAVKILLKQFEINKIIEIKYKVDNTAFCMALKPDLWQEEKLRSIALNSYRELVFTKISNKNLIKRFIFVALKNYPIIKFFLPIIKIPYKFLGILKSKQ